MSDYSLMVYNYKTYPVKTANLGDYIQSLAAKQFLPGVSGYIDRDDAAAYSGPKTKMIMNGWYKMSPGNENIPGNIIPLYISVHISDKALSPAAVKNFKKYEPIGCRDMYTSELLNKYGVKTYFSGCLTLTLGKTYSSAEKTDEIIFTDAFLKKRFFNIFISAQRKRQRFAVSPSERAKFLLPENLEENIVYQTHDAPLDSSHEERFALAEKLLRRYARAKFVITNRLHAVLPCVAVGTPAILLFNKFDASRYKGLSDFFNYYSLKSGGSRIETKNIDLPSGGTALRVVNPQAYIPYKKSLEETVENFINKNL